MLLSEGQMSDYKGAALMLDALPPAKTLLGDRGYDAGWFRNALAERGIVPCIPSKTNRKKPIEALIEHCRNCYNSNHLQGRPLPLGLRVAGGGFCCAGFMRYRNARAARNMESSSDLNALYCNAVFSSQRGSRVRFKSASVKRMIRRK